MLERGRQVLEKKEFNSYIGFVFERVAKEFLIERQGDGGTGIKKLT